MLTKDHPDYDAIHKNFQVTNVDTDGFHVKFPDIKIKHDRKIYDIGDVTLKLLRTLYGSSYNYHVRCVSGRHPHILEGSVCLGDNGTQYFLNMMRQEEYLASVMLLKEILSNYGGDPHYDISTFDLSYRECCSCGNGTCESTVKCRRTKKDICKTCKPVCYDSRTGCYWMPQYLFTCKKCNNLRRTLNSKNLCKGCQ